MTLNPYEHQGLNPSHPEENSKRHILLSKAPKMRENNFPLEMQDEEEVLKKMLLVRNNYGDCRGQFKPSDEEEITHREEQVKCLMINFDKQKSFSH